MPHYEFFCHVCKKVFSKVLSLAEYQEGEAICPRCGSKEVEQTPLPRRAPDNRVRRTAPKVVIDTGPPGA
jgi:putative FmdB family regulatory protein